MSEYQYVAFRAIDRPVTKKNLEYMERQSSRAEITAWSFTNEYHYGDFRGNALEMLRRGYDIHLHYANYGIRTILIRLPNGFPDHTAAKRYFGDSTLRFVKDKHGPGGTLAIEPCFEPGDLEDLWDIDEWLDRLVPLRAEILAGDLRPLYVAHLGAACDINHDPEETEEAPVPAGLASPTDAQLALAEFYEISEALIAAASRESPATSPTVDTRARYIDWVRRQPESAKNNLLIDLMANSDAPIRGELLAAFRKEEHVETWPIVDRKRTIGQLQNMAEEIQQQIDKKTAATAARNRAKKLAKMAEDPSSFLQEVEQLVAQRSVNSYEKASKLLANLREATAGSEQASLADLQARKLHQKHPSLRSLISALRREGFLPRK